MFIGVFSVLELICNITNVTMKFFPLYGDRLLKKFDCIFSILAAVVICSSAGALIQFEVKQDVMCRDINSLAFTSDIVSKSNIFILIYMFTTGVSIKSIVIIQCTHKIFWDDHLY